MTEGTANTTTSTGNEKKPVGKPKKDTPITVDTVSHAETVTVSKEDWESMRETVRLLTKTVDQGQFQRLQKQTAKDPLREVHLQSIGGDIIVEWSGMKKDHVYFDGGRLIEDQILGVKFLNGKEKDLKLSDFPKVTHRVGPYQIKKVSKESITGHEVFTIDIDGQLVEIDSRFVN